MKKTLWNIQLDWNNFCSVCSRLIFPIELFIGYCSSLMKIVISVLNMYVSCESMFFVLDSIIIYNKTKLIKAGNFHQFFQLCHIIYVWINKVHQSRPYKIFLHQQLHIVVEMSNSARSNFFRHFSMVMHWKYFIILKIQQVIFHAVFSTNYPHLLSFYNFSWESRI